MEIPTDNFSFSKTDKSLYLNNLRQRTKRLQSTLLQGEYDYQCFESFSDLLKFLLSSAALANRERWYKPPVVREIEEEVEQEGGDGGEAEGEEESTQPPSKKANVEVDDTGKGALPGSHPGNVRKY